VVGGFVIGAGRMAMRVRTAPSSTTGSGVVVGHEAVVRAQSGVAQVFVAGAWWSVHSQSPLTDGQIVTITAMDGLRLEVEPVLSADSDSSGKGETT